MDKVHLELKEIPFEDKRHNGVGFKVIPYISLENKLQLIETYLDSLFAEGDAHKRFITAEYALMLSVTELCTNIAVDDEDIINKLVYTGVWDGIRENIVNYDEFREELDAVVGMKYDEMSISSGLNALIAKVSKFIENISQMDLSDNGIKALTDSFQSLEKGVGELKTTFGDNGNAQPKKGRPRKNAQ